MVIRSMLVPTGSGTLTFMMVVILVILVNLVDQPKMLKVHVRRGGKPEGHQHQRDDAPNKSHAGIDRGKRCAVQGTS